ncbi:gamma-glutamyltransferase [Halovulum dunhuangense]|uniref:Glutathione hydrolase proenzyme n=1 Tax=Halovulum dunhuangense TaxID=1505036 RepID=A0A849KZS1_9RHOB|nr:gamma-glutamyltransferase [Halovulum dunhuangense]NNU79554.1 gamma-glutamyltransferase [Halovulum dunhuangense]
MKRFSTLAVAAAWLGAAGGALAQAVPAQPEQTFSVVANDSIAARDYLVAAAHPLAVEVGRDVLAAGGSAADAAIAVQFMLNLVEPQSSGIGGGAFALYWDASEGRLTSFDGREKAPMAAGPDYFLKEDGTPMGFWEAVIGGRSVGVPGTLKLLETLHAKHGRTPWADLVEPAIRQAEQGFQISLRMASSIADAQERGLADFAEARGYFFTETGAPKPAGTVLKNPAFARTLRLIAAHGSAPFYEGAIAGDIVAAVRGAANPGMLTLEDMAAYEVVERAPVCVEYRAHDVCGMGPPSSGGLTVGQILGMLENFEMGDAPTVGGYHLFIEASRLAYADRGLYMADSDFVRMPTEGLIDPLYLDSRAALIETDQAMETAAPGTPPFREGMLLAPDTQAERPGTTHFVIVDRHGDMVSMTTTIETGFGSRVMTGGFLLNNELTDFSFVPMVDGKPVANRVEPGKRPRSSMAPTVVLRDGAPVMLTGSPGGARIIPYVALSLIGVIDWGLDPQAAIDMGHVTNLNGPTDLEEGTGAAEMAAELEAMGHEVRISNLNSGLHVVTIGPEGMLGAADGRREGSVAGE